MNYVFHFADIWDARAELLEGTLLTLRLSALSMVLSLFFAMIGAFLRTSGPRPVRAVVASYVEIIRNTPFLVQIFRLVVLPQALRVVVPPLGSQFILLMLNSSVCSVISADELTAMAQDVQARTFRPFEACITVTIIYLVLSLLFSGVFAGIERLAFGRKVVA